MASIPESLSAQESRPDLSGKSILITGTSSGFGHIGALYYAQLGAKVIASMRNTPRSEADALRKEAAKKKLDLHVIDIDVLSQDSVEAGVAEAERIAGGGVDVLINNAGIGITGPVEIQDMTASQLMFETNVLGIQRMVHAALPAMRARKTGLVVNMSSQLGRVIVPGAGLYSATKFALEALSEQLAYELVQHNIDVSIIQPGGYPTRIWVNRNRYTKALKDRSDADSLAGYGAMAAAMGEEDGSGRTADPLDVPRAIAEIMAMKSGQRPLRRAVSASPIPQTPINDISAKVQQDWLGDTPFGPWVKSVHNG